MHATRRTPSAPSSCSTAASWKSRSRRIEKAMQDLRLAFRGLRAAPVVSAVAILSLALGSMALGAAYAGIVGLVLRRVALLVLCGIAAGSVLSWWTSRFVGSTLLYGVEARDPRTLIAAAIVLAIVGTIAGWLPARRAARIDPAAVLRNA